MRTDILFSIAFFLHVLLSQKELSKNTVTVLLSIA